MEETKQSLSHWTDILESQIYNTRNVQLEELQNAFAHITEEKDKGLYGLCNYYMAYYDLRNGRTDECLHYLNESIRCMAGTAQETNVSRSYNILGIIAHGQNNLPMAAEHYNKALIYADLYQDHLIHNVIVSNMADMYYRVGMYEKAFQCYRESMTEYERSGDHSAVGVENYMMMLAGYGYCLCMADRTADAEKVAGKLDALQKGKDAEQLPKLYISTFFALLCHRLGKDREAFSHLNAAVRSAVDEKQLARDFDGILNLLELLVMLEKFGFLGVVLDSMEPLAMEENNNALMLQLLAYRLQYCADTMTQAEYLESAELFFRIQEEQGNQENSLVLHMLEMRGRLWKIEEQKELETENIRLRYQADHDELSGLYNKGCLNRYAEDTFKRAVKERLTLSVFFVDIDYFKQLNDLYGHQKGDECVQAVAESIRQSMPEDFAARYGGDEFVVEKYSQRQFRSGRCADRDGWSGSCGSRRGQPCVGFPGGSR